jgi:YfiR/HmsC-like
MTSERCGLSLRGESRRGACRWLGASLVGALVTFAGPAGSQSVRIPAAMQAALLVKVASFDRNFAARAGRRAVVLVVQAADNKESAHDAASISAALAEVPLIGSVPHEEVPVTYRTAPALAELVRSKRAAIVYLGSGLSGQVGAIRDALSSVNVLTFGAVPEYVPSGVVLGVDLISGRPKLLVNIGQAQKQQVAFPASVLNLMKVYP